MRRSLAGQIVLDAILNAHALEPGTNVSLDDSKRLEAIGSSGVTSFYNARPENI